jgi:hypothetical protein
VFGLQFDFGVPVRILSNINVAACTGNHCAGRQRKLLSIRRAWRYRYGEENYRYP